MSRKLKQQLNAGNSLVVECQPNPEQFPPEVKRVKCFVKNGAGKLEPVLEDLPPATPINAEVPKVTVAGHDLNGTKPQKKPKKSRMEPTTQQKAQKKTFVLGTLQTSVMKKATDPTSYWNTVPGLKRRIELIKLNASGNMMKDVKSSDATKKASKGKIAELQKRIKEFEEGN